MRSAITANNRLIEAIYGLFRIIRPVNLLMIAGTVLFARVFLIGHSSNWRSILLSEDIYLIIISLVCTAAAGYIINDYYDVKIDLINHPERVIIGKSIKRREALFIHGSITFLSVFTGTLVSLKVGVVIIFLSFLLWLYSNYLKRTPFWGNLTVAFVTASTLWLLAIHYEDGQRMVMIYAVFAFFISLVREIAKDMEDKKGDADHGCRTLPIVLGLVPTKYILYTLCAVFLIAVYIVGASLRNLHLGLYFIVLTLLVLALCAFIYRADTVRSYHLISLYCKLIMVTGILSMAII